MSRHIPICGLLGVLVILGGCASSRGTQSGAPASASSTGAAPPHQMMMHGAGKGGMMQGDMMGGGMMSGMCPMTVPGTTVAVADADGGVALTFTTTKPAEVDELRGRVKRMATMHNQGGMMGGGMMGGGMMGGGTMRGGTMRGDNRMMADGPMPRAETSTEDVDGGTRLIFKPKDAAQLEALREHVKKQAEHMQHGTCPMMSAQADAAPADTK